MLIWEGVWHNSLDRTPPWLPASSVKNKTNKLFQIESQPSFVLNVQFLFHHNGGKLLSKKKTLNFQQLILQSSCQGNHNSIPSFDLSVQFLFNHNGGKLVLQSSWQENHTLSNWIPTKFCSKCTILVAVTFRPKYVYFRLSLF